MDYKDTVDEIKRFSRAGISPEEALKKLIQQQELRNANQGLGVIQGQKHDGGKLRLDLLPVRALKAIGEVLTHGAQKYGDRNWETGLDYNRPYGATLRHLLDWWDGEEIDKDSGLLTIAHATTELLFLLEYTLRKRTDLDNRPYKGDHERYTQDQTTDRPDRGGSV